MAEIVISIEHNWLFIHIPKTGGNSLQSVLWHASEDRLLSGGFRDGIERFELQGRYTSRKHATLQEYANVLPPEIFERLLKFTIVRDPWARAISYYFSPSRWLPRKRQPQWSAAEFERALRTCFPQSTW